MPARRFPFVRLFASLTLALAVGASAGCAPGRPLDARISAGSPENFKTWRAKIEPRLSPEETAEFEAALQEIRHSITTYTREASDPATVEAHLRARIDGVALRQLYLDGARLRILRLTPEHDAIRAALEESRQKLRAAEAADTEPLRARIERQTARLRVLADELATAEARLLALGVTTPDDESSPAAIETR